RGCRGGGSVEGAVGQGGVSHRHRRPVGRPRCRPARPRRGPGRSRGTRPRRRRPLCCVGFGSPGDAMTLLDTAADALDAGATEDDARPPGGPADAGEAQPVSDDTAGPSAAPALGGALVVATTVVAAGLVVGSV